MEAARIVALGKITDYSGLRISPSSTPTHDGRVQLNFGSLGPHGRMAAWPHGYNGIMKALTGGLT